MTSEQKIQVTFRNAVTIDKQTNIATFFCLLCEQKISTTFPFREPLPGDGLDIIHDHFAPSDGLTPQCPTVKNEGLGAIAAFEWEKAKEGLPEEIRWPLNRSAKSE
jgi:hypothetical protein